ncbi:MAG: Y-family DNA polymerase [Verrucomicrobia bacterium]|nr:Y-family DNA polymerase [Verrucomicrobiota bacterium]
MIALVDVNSFYASCEQVFRPDLWGRPVVVLSNNDGCVIAANREAKSLGIPMWKPAYQSMPLLERHGVAVFSSNYPLYGDMSRRVMETLATMTPDLEVYSIDEAFLRVPDCETDLTAYAQRVRARVHQWTGLPVGVGIAPTKALTKVASRMAKRERDRTRNVFVIADEETRARALSDFPVEDLWGIGRRIAARLQSRGVGTAAQFTALSDEWVRKELTVNGLRLKRELLGHPQLSMEVAPPPKKMLGTAKSFGRELTDETLVREALAYYVAECGVKLRRQKFLAGNLTVYLETNPFREGAPQYVNQTECRLSVPTDDTLALTRQAEAALSRIFRTGYAYKKVGVWLSGLVRPQAVQQDLFCADPGPRHDRVMAVMDRVNQRYGKGSLQTGAAGFRREQWKLRQERLSPRYTTCLEEVLTVR